MNIIKNKIYHRIDVDVYEYTKYYCNQIEMKRTKHYIMNAIQFNQLYILQQNIMDSVIDETD